MILLKYCINNNQLAALSCGAAPNTDNIVVTVITCNPGDVCVDDDGLGECNIKADVMVSFVSFMISPEKEFLKKTL